LIRIGKRIDISDTDIPLSDRPSFDRNPIGADKSSCKDNNSSTDAWKVMEFTLLEGNSQDPRPVRALHCDPSIWAVVTVDYSVGLLDLYEIAAKRKCRIHHAGIRIFPIASLIRWKYAALCSAVYRPISEEIRAVDSRQRDVNIEERPQRNRLVKPCGQATVDRIGYGASR
jgi:hypothetical protein